MFTITRETRRGVLEYLTVKGFRNVEKLSELGLKKLWFSKKEGTTKVNELRKNARGNAYSKPILNYS